MATQTETHPPPTIVEHGRLRLGAVLMTLASLAFVGYAVVFFVRNFTGSFLELGIGPNEAGATRDEVRAFSPDLYHYISHLNLAVSAFIATTALATAALTWFGVRRGLWWAYVTAVGGPVLGLAVSVPAHFPYHFDTATHLGPIYVVSVVFLGGALLALGPMLSIRAQRSRATR